MTAKAEDLGTLHELLTGVYKELLAGRAEPLLVGGEVILDEHGNPRMRRVYPSAAELAAVNAFLKNNAITAAADNDSALADLRKMMDERRAGRKPALADPHADMPAGMFTM